MKTKTSGKVLLFWNRRACK